MKMNGRRPTMDSAIATLRQFGFDVDHVVDIGVLRGTDYLMSHFPRAFHHLFEPIDTHADQIEHNYRNLPHKLHRVALSSGSGDAYQVGVCRDGSGKVTHSFLADKHQPPGSRFTDAPVIECERVRMATLDEHFAAQGMPQGRYLVKIDVDGHEMPIIEGGRQVLMGADLVIVEATVTALLQRANALAACGLQLVDIVDMCYFHDTLSQVDLIFASGPLLARLRDLRPWGFKPFSSDAWFVLSPTLA